MTNTDPDRAWLAARLPFIVDQLPPPPARVVEIGCGPLGGFVPGVTEAGHHAVGIDPEAPDGEHYRRMTFEEYDDGSPVDVVVACTSLHHVADLDEVLTKAGDLLVPEGRIVVIEWAHELFDEATARWSFDRLRDVDRDHQHAHHDDHQHEGGNWLVGHQEEWKAAGRSWPEYFQAWATDHGLHTGHAVLDVLEARFTTELLVRTPYVFPNLRDTTEADEQSAIDQGLIQPTALNYVGRRVERAA